VIYLKGGRDDERGGRKKPNPNFQRRKGKEGALDLHVGSPEGEKKKNRFYLSGKREWDRGLEKKEIYPLVS